eukprot:TRINITY_DN15331_c0_g1_i1.p2 TRINITY_DN15331_c0_g1~~TRINITY_DN15331_c0_g1_i1.p2  ORF type:complete len:102 (+),score=28.70 TRINITY_DN15331_c0_g1_i1:449-754(+)
MEQLMSRVKLLEKILSKDYLKKQMDELLIKQKSEFISLKKLLVGTVENAVDSMRLGTKIHQRRSKERKAKHNTSTHQSISHKDEYLTVVIVEHSNVEVWRK